MKGEVISLSIREPDFVTPIDIREPVFLSLEQKETHITHQIRGFFIELREAINYMQRRFQLQYNASHEIVVTVVGGSEAIDLLIRAVSNPGDEVIIRARLFCCL